MNFKHETRKIALESLNGIKAINAKIEKLKSEKLKYSDSFYNQELKKLTDEKNGIIVTGKAKVEKMADEYRAKIHSDFQLKGEELTEDAALFSSAISISHRQLEELAEKHKNNNTMLQMIYQYAERNQVPLGKHGKTESERLAFVDSMVNYYKSVTGRPEYSDIWEDDNHFETAFGSDE